MGDHPGRTAATQRTTSDRPTVDLEVVRCARVPTPRDYVFRPAGRGLGRWVTGLRAGADALDAPCLFFIVRHPDVGVMLIDTGLHPASHASRADFGVPMRLLFAGLEPLGEPFDEQLRQRALDPDDVRRVVMTHLHVDHTSGMRSLPNATFTCSLLEWRAAHARRAALKGYVAHHLPPADRVALVDLDGDGQPCGPFDRTFDLLGDGSIRLIATPGHTPGHLSVLLHTSARGDVLLVGDAAYTTQSIDTGTLPLLTDDDAASRRSLHALKAFCDQRPEVLALPSHDPRAWRDFV